MSIAAIDVDSCTPDAREQLLDALHARQAALHVEQLRLIKVADAAKDWQADGMHSMAHWLSYRYNLSPSTASAWVRAAGALDTMPKTMAVYEAGRISFDQLTAALSFAKPEDDGWLAALLPEISSLTTTAMAKQRRRVRAAERDEADQRTVLRFRKHPSGLGQRVSGFFTHDDAAIVEEALSRRADAMGPDPQTGRCGPYEQRLAQALREQCDEDLSEHNRSVGSDAHVVVVHTPAGTVRGDESAGSATIRGEPIHDDTLHRLLCDTRIEFSIDEPDGRTVGIGRAGRTLPRWLRRRVLGRDHGCCRWSGCSRPARHVHHMRHWTRDGGHTNASNLISLCWHHHHLLHEGGWEARGNADVEVTFVSPYDRVLHSRAGPIAA